MAVGGAIDALSPSEGIVWPYGSSQPTNTGDNLKDRITG
jgi:hypothetical protein